MLSLKGLQQLANSPGLPDYPTGYCEIATSACGLKMTDLEFDGRGGCVAAVLGIYGDLFASVVKRQCGIKDYGTIFPGHGGILDRFDSVMFIAPFVTMVITAVFYK